MAKKNLGADMALVNLKDGGSALVPRGEDIPPNLADGEDKRLADLGVFDPPPAPPVPVVVEDPRVADLERQLQEATAAREAAEKALAAATPSK